VEFEFAGCGVPFAILLCNFREGCLLLCLLNSVMFAFLWNVECGMWNVECGMWNVECGM
jgi:hypothetical protein